MFEASGRLMRPAAWSRVLLSVVLAAGCAGCSKEALNRRGIEVKDGKVKRVFKF